MAESPGPSARSAYSPQPMRLALRLLAGLAAMAGVIAVALVVAWSPPPPPDTPPLRYALWQAPADIVAALKTADPQNRLDHTFESATVTDYDRIVVFVETWPDIATFPPGPAFGLDLPAIAALPATNLIHASSLRFAGRGAPVELLVISLPQLRARDAACIGPLLRDAMLRSSWGPSAPPLDLDNYLTCPG